jgi:hypothetical protein
MFLNKSHQIEKESKSQNSFCIVTEINSFIILLFLKNINNI